MPFKERHGGDHHAGRADAALRAATFEKRLLHGIQPLAAGDPLDRANVCSLCVDRGDEATVHDSAVQEHRARAAFAFPAAFFRAGEMQFLPQNIEQPGHRKRLHAARLAVDSTRDVNPADRFRQARPPFPLWLPSTLPAWREFRARRFPSRSLLR